MSRRTSEAHRRVQPALTTLFRVLPLLAALALAGPASVAQAQQRNDEEYTRKIKEYLRDPRISTELVDHLPASNTVPTPLKFHGRSVGTWGELTYAKDIHRYMEAIAKAVASPASLPSISSSAVIVGPKPSPIFMVMLRLIQTVLCSINGFSSRFIQLRK